MTEATEDIGHLMTSLTAAVARATELTLEPFMLSTLDYGIIDRCHREEANTATELARVFPVDVSVISRRVNDLVGRGLLSRRRLSGDRRRIRLSLTEEGRSVERTLAERVRESRTTLMNRISGDEWAAFIATSHKIMANLEAATAPSPARRESPTRRLTTYGVRNRRMIEDG